MSLACVYRKSVIQDLPSLVSREQRQLAALGLPSNLKSHSSQAVSSQVREAQSGSDGGI